MRSLVGRAKRGSSRSLVEQLTSLTSSGDGSTLSLDFTTGVLDSRLTFTRASDATFINSQGLVQWADANMFPNSAWNDANNVPSGWSGFNLSATATVTVPVNDSEARRISVGATSEQPFIFLAPTVAQGITYTASIEIVSTTQGSIPGEQIQYSQVISPPFATTFDYYMNGVKVGSGGTGNGNAQVVGSGVLTVVYVAAASSQIRIGFAAAPRANCSMVVKAPQHQPGTAITRGTFFRRTAAEGAYSAPRFDHDPTTRAPRGLLVEGQIENLCQQGQYCWGTGATNTWARSAEVHVNAVNGTAGASAVARIDGPDGGSLTGTSLFKQAGTATFVRTNINVAVAQSTTYTFSAYVRAPSGGNPYIRLAVFNGGTWLNTTGGTTASGITITNTAGSGSQFNGVPSTAWVRIWVTFTTQVGQTAATIAFYPDTDTTSAATMYVWGAQVEAASGPSSVILTGASTATRNQDVCYMDTAQVNSWFIKNNEATFQVRYSCDNALSANTNVFHLGQWATEYSYGYQHYTYAGSGGTLSGNGKLVSATSADNGIYGNQSLPRVFNTAFSFSTSASLVANSWNGNTPSQLSATSWPTWTSTTIRLGIGTSAASGTSSSAGFMRIQSLKYWPTRLPNAQLQSLTT